MKVDEAVSMAARAAMRGLESGVDPDEWASFADCAIDASIEAAKAVRAAREAGERKRPAAPEELRALRQRAFVASLQFATAALMTLAHVEGLDAVEWPEEMEPERLA